jgi:hypothetical protein
MYRQRLHVEVLEPRLPPGDAVLGTLIGLSLFDSPVSDEKREFTPLGHDWVAGAEQRESPVESRDFPHIRQTIKDSAPAARKQEPKNEDNPLPQTFSRPAHAASSATSQTVAANETLSVQRAAGLIPAVRPAMSHHAPSFAPAGLTPGFNPALQQSSAAEDFGNLPLTFEANQGQTDPSVDFITRTGDATVYLTSTAAVFSITQPASVDALARRDLPEHGGLTPRRSPQSTVGVALHMNIVGANPDAVPVGREQLPGIVNYFIGNDPNQWHTNIPTFARVQYDDVYPGIDLAYYGSPFSRDPQGARASHLEYDFIVSPGANPAAIALDFAGADDIEVNRHGDLVLHTAIGDVVQQAPLTYQEIGGNRQEVPSRYVIDGNRVSFDVGAYDPSRPLVIDPLVMGYSTYLGGTSHSDSGYAITVDDNGSAFIGGDTWSSNFPVTPGAFDTHGAPVGENGFLAKLSADGSTLEFATYLGGSIIQERTLMTGLALTVNGNAVVTGWTGATTFPTSELAYDKTYNGDWDGFVTKFSPDGSALVYSTYIGGANADNALGLALDGDGNAYIPGYTNSTDYPVTPGAFDVTKDGTYDGFLTKLSADGSALAFSTFVGGSGNDFGWNIAVESGNAYLSGRAGSVDFPATFGAFDTTLEGASDAFVAKLNAEGSALEYATLFGGSGVETGAGISVIDGFAYVGGGSNSPNLPTTADAFDSTLGGTLDAYALKLNQDGSALVYASYFGGSSDDVAWIMTATDGTVYLGGLTKSTDFPTTPDAFDRTFNGTSQDAFAMQFDIDAKSLEYSTYLGGTGSDQVIWIAVGNTGSIYVTGDTNSREFPTTPGSLKRRNRGGVDGFVTKFTAT